MKYLPALEKIVIINESHKSCKKLQVSFVPAYVMQFLETSK